MLEIHIGSRLRLDPPRVRHTAPNLPVLQRLPLASVSGQAGSVGNRPLDRTEYDTGLRRKSGEQEL